MATDRGAGEGPGVTAMDTTLTPQGNTQDSVCAITSSMEPHRMLAHPVARNKQACT